MKLTSFSKSVNRISARAPRSELATTCASVTSQSHSNIPATVIAMTAVDLRLCIDANPELGEQIQVTLGVPDSDSIATVSGIVHWTEMRGKNHEVGIFTEQPLPMAIRTHYIDMRRQSERYRCRIQGEILWEDSRRTSTALIVNYSHAGLAVRSDCAGAVDESFTFNWLHRGNPRQVSASALWQIRQDGGFLVGAQMDRGGGLNIAGLPT